MYVPVGGGTGGQVGVPPQGAGVDPLADIISDPLSPLFSGDTLSLLAEGDFSTAIFNYSTNVSGKLLAYLRALYDIARDDSFLKEILDASFGLSSSLSYAEIAERFQFDDQDIQEANGLIQDYNDYVAELEASAADINGFGNSFTTAFPSVNGTDDALTSFKSQFNALVVSHGMDDIDNTTEAERNAFLAAVNGLVNTADTTNQNMRNTYLGVSPDFSEYQSAVNDFTNNVTNPSVDEQDWTDYQASVVAATQPEDVFPPIPQLPDLDLQAGVPTSYNAPDASLNNTSFDSQPSNASKSNLISYINGINNSFDNAINRASNAEDRLGSTVSHFNLNSGAFGVSVNALQEFAVTEDEYINQVVGNQLILEAVEIGELIANLLGVEKVEFTDVLKFVASRAIAISSLTPRAAGSGASSALDGVAASKVVELFSKSILEGVLNQTRYEEILKGFDPLSKEVLFQIEALFTTSVGLGSLFAASIAFNQLSQLELDLNTLNADLTTALLTLEMLNQFNETTQEFFAERIEETLAQIFQTEELDLDQRRLGELAKAIADLITENVLGNVLAAAKNALGISNSALASEIVDIFVDSLAESAERSRADLRDKEARNQETARLEAILTTFRNELDFKSTVDQVNAGDLTSVREAVNFALGPVDVPAGANKALVNAIGQRLRNLGEGGDSFDGVSGAVDDALGRFGGVLSTEDRKFVENQILVKFNENEAETKMLNDNLFARNESLTTKQQDFLSGRLGTVIRGNVHDSFVGHLNKGRELVREDVKEVDRITTEASLFKQFYNNSLLPPADKYYFEKQQPGKEWMGLSIIADRLQGSVPTPQVRGAIDFAV